MTDSICKCKKCGGSVCYQIMNDHVVAWKCLVCGFETSTYLMKGTDTLSSFEENIPRLYIDLKHEDEDGLVWYPQYIANEGVGVLTVDGTSKDNWFWAFFPHIAVEEHEKERFKGAKYKINVNAALQFNQDQFPLALQACGLLNNASA